MRWSPDHRKHQCADVQTGELSLSESLRDQSAAAEVKTSDLKDLEAQDETVIARAIVRCLHEFPVFAQKCICVLAMKSTITVRRAQRGPVDATWRGDLKVLQTQN